MSHPDSFPALDAGAPGTPDGTALDSSDRERLLYVARVLRELGNQGRHAPIGDTWSEVIVALGALRKVLGMSTAEFEAEGIVAVVAPHDPDQARPG